MAPRTLAWIVVFLLVASIALRLQGYFYSDDADTLTKEQAAYSFVRDKILTNYVHRIEEKELFYDSLEGMAHRDQHSLFFRPEQYKKLNEDISGHFEGVGMDINTDDKGLYVVVALIGTPAYQGGVLPGDRILKIDNISTHDMGKDEATRRIKGNAGTTVVLELLHEGEKQPVTVTLKRATIQMQSVQFAEILGPEWVSDPQLKIGFVEVEHFQEKTAADLDAAVRKLKEQGMQALILDLRQNPGGQLDAACDVVSLFLKKGLVVTVVSRNESTGKETQEDFYTNGRGTHLEFPLAVLIDSRSASASEIVSGALKDHGRAVLVGDRSYGKFSVQRVMDIPLQGWGTAGLKLTIAKYHTLRSPCIDGKGIVPDYKVPSSEDQQTALLNWREQCHLVENNPKLHGQKPPDLKPFDDVQLKRAVEVISSKLKN
jgi:carboxyl-terminal processing protease